MTVKTLLRQLEQSRDFSSEDAVRLTTLIMIFVLSERLAKINSQLKVLNGVRH